MRRQPALFNVIMLVSIALFFMALFGCGTTPEQPSSGLDQQQSDAEKTTEGKETPAANTTKSQAAAREVAPAPAPPRKATLPAGTPITIVTSATLSTKTNKSGEAFQASLDRDIAEGDWIIATRGASVTGVIADSDPGGRVKGVASITLKLEKLTLADGQKVPIMTHTYSASAKSTKKKDAAKIGIGAGLGAAIGAIAGGGKGAAIGAGVGGAAGTGATLATRGDAASIPSETRITFKLAAPLEVIEKK